MSRSIPPPPHLLDARRDFNVISWPSWGQVRRAGIESTPSTWPPQVRPGIAFQAPGEAKGKRNAEIHNGRNWGVFCGCELRRRAGGCFSGPCRLEAAVSGCLTEEAYDELVRAFIYIGRTGDTTRASLLYAGPAALQEPGLDRRGDLPPRHSRHLRERKRSTPWGWTSLFRQRRGPMALCSLPLCHRNRFAAAADLEGRFSGHSLRVGGGASAGLLAGRRWWRCRPPRHRGGLPAPGPLCSGGACRSWGRGPAPLWEARARCPQPTPPYLRGSLERSFGRRSEGCRPSTRRPKKRGASCGSG